MSVNLYAASNQWASRPDDERFGTVDELLAFTRAERDASIQSAPLPFNTLRAVADEGAVSIEGSTGKRAALTHFAFSQVSAIAHAPAEFLRQLPAGLAVDVLNDRLANTARTTEKHDLRILFRQNGSLLTRAITSDVYDRVWNADVVEQAVVPLTSEGFRVPPARPCRAGQKGTRTATEADILPGQGDFGLSVKVGDEIAPAGLYASDRDMFAFLVDPRRGVDIGGRRTMRGVFLRNSEVGDGSLIFDWFDLDSVCGNHIVWGATNRNQVRVRHVGSNTLDRALARYEVEAKRFDDASSEREALVTAARKYTIAASKEEVIKAVVKFAKTRSLPLSGKAIEAAADTAEARTDRYGAPNTAWAVSSGLTENSQALPNMSDRHAVDVAAGKVLAMAF